MQLLPIPVSFRQRKSEDALVNSAPLAFQLAKDLYSFEYFCDSMDQTLIPRWPKYRRMVSAEQLCKAVVNVQNCAAEFKER